MNTFKNSMAQLEEGYQILVNKYMNIRRENNILITDSMKYKHLHKEVLCKLQEFMCYFEDGEYNTLNDLFTQSFVGEVGSILTGDIFTAAKITELNSIYDTSKNLIDASGRWLMDPSSSIYDPDKNIFLRENIVDISGISCERLYYVHDNIVFDKYKSNVHKILNSLNNVIWLYNNSERKDDTINNLKAQVEKYDLLFKDSSGIPYDSNTITKNINEFLSNRERSLNMKTNLDFSDLQYTLLPQIELYIKRHGPPLNGIFKSELMSDIVKDLLDAGILENLDEDPDHDEENICEIEEDDEHDEHGNTENNNSDCGCEGKDSEGDDFEVGISGNRILNFDASGNIYGDSPNDILLPFEGPYEQTYYPENDSSGVTIESDKPTNLTLTWIETDKKTTVETFKDGSSVNIITKTINDDITTETITTTTENDNNTITTETKTIVEENNNITETTTTTTENDNITTVETNIKADISYNTLDISSDTLDISSNLDNITPTNPSDTSGNITLTINEKS